VSEAIRSRIIGLGTYLPPKVLTNSDLEKMVDTTDDWILSRTGIQERRVVENGRCTSDLASEAGKIALQRAAIKPTDLDMIIVASITPDSPMPATACKVQQKIGAGNVAAFDITAACSGFPYALSVADAFIRTGQYKHILVIGAEVLSPFIDWEDRSTCVLFGDGAGAAVLSASSSADHGILAHYLGADGALGDILKIPAGGSAMPPTKETIENKMHTVKMAGAEVFKVAVRTMADAVAEVLKRANVDASDVDIVIPHQANQRILQATAERLSIPVERVFINLHKYGNMSAASTPIALCEAFDAGLIKDGSIVILVAFGGGLTWASSVIRW